MDYEDLAGKFLQKMQGFHKARPYKNIWESMQGEAFVLYLISLRDGDVLPGEISHEMDVSSARIAAALNNLEKKGLIARRIDESDRRKILVSITETGRETAERQSRAVTKGVAGMLSILGERDAVDFVRITGRVTEIANECSEIFNGSEERK